MLDEVEPDPSAATTASRRTRPCWPRSRPAIATGRSGSCTAATAAGSTGSASSCCPTPAWPRSWCRRHSFGCGATRAVSTPSRGSAASFIFTIARRLAVDLYRRPSSRPDEPEPPDAPTEDQVDRLVVKLGVREALDTLSEAHRQVLELSFRDHLKQAEIAQKLGIPLGTVKTRSHHALRQLKTVLEQREIHG